MPVSALKAYLKAYGLPSPTNMLEKEEIVDAIINARVRTIVTVCFKNMC